MTDAREAAVRDPRRSQRAVRPQLEGIRPSATVALLAFIVGGIAAPTFILATSSGQPLATSRTYLYLLITVVAAARLSMLIGRGTPRIAFAVFYLFIFVCLGIAPLTQVATGISNVILQPSNLAEAAVMVLISIASLEIGALLARVRSETAPDLDPSRSGLLDERRLLVLSVVGLAGSAYYIHDVGFSALFSNRENLLAALAPTQQVISGVVAEGSLAGQALVLAAGTAPVLVAWVAWTRILFATDWRRKVAPWAGWVVLALVNVAVNNPISNSRFWALTVFFGFAFSLRSVGPKFFRTAMILGVVAAIFVFPYADYFRESATTKAEFASPSQSIEFSLADKDYDQMTMTANAVSWITIRGGHTDGSQLASSALFFIPHSIWPGRATDTGVAIAQILPTANENQNLSSPLWVEFWVDFGWLGVVIGFVLFGLGLTKLDGLYVRVKSSHLAPTSWIEIALPVLVGYEFIVLRGPLLQAMARLVALVVCLLLIRRTNSASLPMKSSPRRTLSL